MKFHKLLLGILVLIAISSISVFGAECGAIPTQNCTVSNNLELEFNQTFYLNDSDLNGAIIINSNNIVLNCNYSTISGNTTGYGVTTNFYDNITFINCNFNNYSRGIYASASDNLKIINSIFKYNVLSIYIRNSNNISIESSIFSDIINVGGSSYFIRSENNKHINLSNDYFYGINTTPTGSGYYSFGSFLNLDNLICKDSIFYMNKYGISNEDSTYINNSEIINCSFINQGLVGIKGIRNSNITENYFYNSSHNHISSGGINNISNNYFYMLENGHHQLDIETFDLVSNNIFNFSDINPNETYDLNGDGQSIYFFLERNISDVIINNNYFINSPSTIIGESDSNNTNISIINNYFAMSNKSNGFFLRIYSNKTNENGTIIYNNTFNNGIKYFLDNGQNNYFNENKITNYDIYIEVRNKLYSNSLVNDYFNNSKNIKILYLYTNNKVYFKNSKIINIKINYNNFTINSMPSLNNQLFCNNSGLSPNSTNFNELNYTLSTNERCFIFSQNSPTEPYPSSIATTINDMNTTFDSSTKTYTASCEGTGPHSHTNLDSVKGENGFYSVYHNGVFVEYSDSNDYTASSCSEWVFSQSDHRLLIPVTGLTNFGSDISGFFSGIAMPMGILIVLLIISIGIGSMISGIFKKII